MSRIPIVTVTALALLLGGTTAAAQDPSGFIHGTVLTESDTEYRGFMRWGRQEAFWDDLFHSLKEDLPYVDEIEDMDLGEKEEDRGGRFRLFNVRIEWEDDGWGASRVFVARFGDIDRIEVRGDEDATVVLRSGESFDVSGYSDDVGRAIRMYDDSLGEIDLEWDRIRTITFSAALRTADPGTERLYGTVETESGVFEGFVMWDKEECTTRDLLDGESEDGELSIEFGRIASIERRGRSSSIVELRDGRRLRLRGSNDVDDDNRGIMIEDERYGKVTVEWDAFDRLELRGAPGSGRGYDDYPQPQPLFGTVITADEVRHRGRVVFDLDEAGTWEMLNGSVRDVSFDIPFERIRWMEPIDDGATLVGLRGGHELELEDSQDVSDANDGLLIYDESDEPVYVRWTDVRRIEFER